MSPSLFGLQFLRFQRKIEILGLLSWPINSRSVFFPLSLSLLLLVNVSTTQMPGKTRKPRKRLIKKSSSTPGKDSSFSDFGIEDDEGGIHRGYGVEEDVEEIMRDDYSDSGGKMKMEKGKKRIGEEKKRKGEKKFKPRKSGWTSRDYEVDPEVKENLGNHCGR